MCIRDRGIHTVDELLILVSQSETVFDFGGWRYNPDFRRNNEGQNTREQYHQQPDQRPSTSSTPPQTSSKPPDKTFEYKGKQNIGRPKRQYKGNDGAPIRAIQTVEIARSDTVEPVSYTHLDVYKRQIQFNSKFSLLIISYLQIIVYQCF